MRSIWMRIPVEIYEIQVNVLKTQMRLFWMLIVIVISMVIFNRYTYSKKHIETEYYNANLTKGEVKSIVPAEEIIEGDHEIIKATMATYVKQRETRMIQISPLKNDYIKSMSTMDIYWRYISEEEDYFRYNKTAIRKVIVNPNVMLLDKGLYQVKFKTIEIKNISKGEITTTSQVATIRIDRFVELEENDARAEIEEFDRLNPLKLEVTIYSTANYNLRRN